MHRQSSAFYTPALVRTARSRYLVAMITEWRSNLLEANLPLLDALALRVPAAPRAFLRQLCKKQRVSLDGRVATAETLVRAGACLAVKASPRWLECLTQSCLAPGLLLYEDAQCMVINKPAGLAIHRALGHDDNLLQRVRDFLRLRGQTFKVAPIHRLDIGTSGAVLFGKGRAAISQLGRMIMAGQASKRYLALIEAPLSRAGELTSAVPAKGSSKVALTRFRPVATAGRLTLLELELGTGRHHQIRHQLAAAGWSIIGDPRYGGKTVAGLDRPFLHCHRLAFAQPSEGREVVVACRLPPELRHLLQTLAFPHELAV